jgi:outer membrane lipopolysaccharide assembly protein LptE/RlpB
MKTIRRLLLLLTVTALGACQPGWVRLDGSQPGSDEIARARARCEVDEKLAALENFSDPEAAPANSNEARMLRIESYDMESARVYREIDSCMQREGLRKR